MKSRKDSLEIALSDKEEKYGYAPYPLCCGRSIDKTTRQKMPGNTYGSGRQLG